jgi:Bacterial extracellular solute-binding proteins, family 3
LLAGRPAAGEPPAPAGGDGLARVRASGVLRWGGDLQGGEPYVFQDPHDPGRIVGFEVDIADALARRLGVRAHFVQNDWQLLIPALVRGATAKAQYRRHLVAREMIANRRGATSWYRGGILCWTHARAA